MGWYEYKEIAEMEEKEWTDLRYRLYVPIDSTKPVVVAMQPNDYFDVDETRFLNDEHYDTRKEAQTELDRIHRLLFGGW